MEMRPSFVLSQLARLVVAETNARDVVLGSEYFYRSVPLALIDAVYSIGVKYSSTRNTVARFCASQHPVWEIDRRKGGVEHTIQDFLHLVANRPSEELARYVYGNRQRTSARNGILKAEAVTRCAQILARHGVNRFTDVGRLYGSPALEAEFRNVPGQRSGLSFDYLKMLCGDENSIKHDRHIETFMRRHGISSLDELKAVARELEISPRELDHAIWQVMSNSAG